ncbi:MAG: pyridoxamine 5'-phosphate oxidase family protein [Spirochaetales bacterium]|nr:MAG: pyridoxamine 5'-phosphate oxidase family protein [Spirochaetales bacterium]
MRRQDRAVTETAEIESILRSADVCHVGMVDGGVPYVVPVNFAYADRCVYFHSARDGKKVSILKENPRVFLEAVTEFTLVPGDQACKWGATFESVMASGLASFVDDPAEKRRALTLIMTRYGGDGEWTYPDQMVDRTLIVKIDIQEMTGKRAAPRKA